MNFGLEILIAALLVAFLYYVFRMIYILFARHELDASACNRKADAIEVFADANSLEYYLRMALAAAEEQMAVIAYIKKESVDKDEMLDIVARFRRTHKNLSYRLI